MTLSPNHAPGNAPAGNVIALHPDFDTVMPHGPGALDELEVPTDGDIIAQLSPSEAAGILERARAA